MTVNNCFNIGDKLEIQTVDDYIDSNKNLVSQLLEINSTDEFSIATPIHDNNLVPIPIGSKIFVNYSIDTKGIYYFTAVVESRVKENISYIKIRQITETKLIQRRDYYRLYINIPIQIYNKDNELISSGYAKDISGGGLRAITDKKVEVNKEIYCKINIEGKECIINGKIIRSSVYEKDLEKSELGIKFLELDEKLRNHIVSFIFKEQRLLRQKGLI